MESRLSSTQLINISFVGKFSEGELKTKISVTNDGHLKKMLYNKQSGQVYTAKSQVPFIFPPSKELSFKCITIVKGK